MKDEDELGAPARRVDALPAGIEVCRVASTEARLKRIIPQNHDAEHRIVRNYVRTSLFTIIICSRVFLDLRWRPLLPPSSNGSPEYYGFRHPQVQTPSHGLTFSRTKSPNWMWTALDSTGLSDRQPSTLLSSVCEL